MNLQFYIEKLHVSEEYKKFMKENPDAYLCSGFFIIDKEKDDNKQHLDFYISKSKKMFCFQLEEGVKLLSVEMLEKNIPTKISAKCDFNFEDVEKKILDKMEKEKINNKIQKIILSLQRKDGKDFIIATVFVSMLGLLKVSYDISEKKITLFEKKSFLDMLRRVK